MGTDDDGQPTCRRQIARGPVAAIIADQAPRHQRRRLLRRQLGPSLREPQRLEQLPDVRRTSSCFPFSLVVMFGRMLKQHAARRRHLRRDAGAVPWPLIGWAICWDTLQAQPGPDRPRRRGRLRRCRTPRRRRPGGASATWTIRRAVAGLPVDQSLGNLEGKELRFGTSAGATFAAVTTARRPAARSTACTTASIRWPA